MRPTAAMIPENMVDPGKNGHFITVDRSRRLQYHALPFTFRVRPYQTNPARRET
jgi:hypothetical protein